MPNADAHKQSPRALNRAWLGTLDITQAIVWRTVGSGLPCHSPPRTPRYATLLRTIQCRLFALLRICRHARGYTCFSDDKFRHADITKFYPKKKEYRVLSFPGNLQIEKEYVTRDKSKRFLYDITST